MNNVVRVSLQALAAVLSGTQSLHTNSLDETLALPTEGAVKLALRTQQIIANESHVINTVDPLGGSYYIESLTNRMEAGAREYFKKIDDIGGMVKAIERGFPQREIFEASHRYQQEVEQNERSIVGVNAFVDDVPCSVPTLKIHPEVELEQVTRLSELRKSRDAVRVADTLRKLHKAAITSENLMPYLIDAVKSYATLGEICGRLKEVFGTYSEPIVL
jgi:methylmalonyl-CoA mutase N-terminal domain/subunit